VELLTVVTILSLLALLLWPALQSTRESARRADCCNRLRQLGIGLHAFHAAAQEFPIGSLGTRGFHQHDRRQISWLVWLLPYVDEPVVRQQFDENQAYDSRENLAAAGTPISIMLCPSSVSVHARHNSTAVDRNGNHRWDPGDGLAFTDYGGMFGAGLPSYPFMNGLMLYEDAVSDRDIDDGLSRTILVGEDAGRPLNTQSEWANGQNVFDQTGPINRTRHNELFSDHPGGVHVVFADGSVRWLSQLIDTPTLLSLCARSDGVRIVHD